MKPLSLDRAWFKKNPSRNYRVRRPGEGEAEEITRRLGPSAARDLALMGGRLQTPSPETYWVVLVVNAAPDTLLRFLTLSTSENPEDIGEKQFGLYAVAMCERVVVDQIRG